MKIIVEGPCGSGKTTLVKRVANLSTYVFGGHVVPYRYPRPSSVRDLRSTDTAYRTIERRIGRMDCLIADRHPVISQRIFALYTFLGASTLDLSADVIVFCDPGIEEIRKNRGNTKFAPVLQEIRDAYNEYAIELAKTSSIRILKFDYRTDDVQFRDRLLHIFETPPKLVDSGGPTVE